MGAQAQLPLTFDEVPLSCQIQKRYHAIAPVLARRATPYDQAAELNLSYQKITRWLRQFRDKGMPGLFNAMEYSREPYTPERVLHTLLHFKCCAPSASDFELARAVSSATGHRLHNETVKALLTRYSFWKGKESYLLPKAARSSSSTVGDGQAPSTGMD
jgi:transposase